MPQVVTQPFYLDWTFWSFVVAGLALVLSQLPPVKLLLRPGKVGVEVMDRIAISHNVGNPQATLHVTITNQGGRRLRITKLSLSLSREGAGLVVLPAQGYFEKFTDPQAVILVPFSLEPEGQWSHSVNFLNFFDRQTDRAYRSASSALREDITAKRAALPAGDNRTVNADERLLQPFRTQFDRLFIWQDGEYTVELSVAVEPASASFKKRYRFTIYESDTADLRKLTEGYASGAGILFNAPAPAAIFCPLTEA